MNQYNRGSSSSVGSIGRGWGGHEHFVGCRRPDDLLYHPASFEASGQGVKTLHQYATKDEGKGVGVVTYCSQAPQDTVV